VSGPAPTSAPSASQPPPPGVNPFDVPPLPPHLVYVAVPSGTQGSDGIAITDLDVLGSPADKTGINALDRADLFNLMAIPPLTRTGADVAPHTYELARIYCKNRRAMLIADAPSSWTTVPLAVANADKALETRDENAVVYFPRIRVADPLKDNRIEEFAPSGAVAGIFARTDTNRGVWKAPAGLEATLAGVRELTVKMTDPENGQLNPLAINCLRSFPVVGNVVWGARTYRGADVLADQWKYLPVRRLALYIEESLYRGTQWVVFEPNDEPLWSQIRLNVGAFMHDLFRKGAFQGSNPRDAYLVKCDKETTTQNDINLGIVNILVGFAPLKPAEFVILKIQQLAGNVQT
jgi:phage tail sheath protein FI